MNAVEFRALMRDHRKDTSLEWEQELSRLLKREIKNGRRITVLKGLHGRFNTLRARREWREIALRAEL